MMNRSSVLHFCLPWKIGISLQPQAQANTRCAAAKQEFNLVWQEVPYLLAYLTRDTYKSASSCLVKKKYPIIKESIWKEYFWSRLFFLLTTGGAPIEVVERYIVSQGEKI